MQTKEPGGKGRAALRGDKGRREGLKGADDAQYQVEKDRRSEQRKRDVT